MPPTPVTPASQTSTPGSQFAGGLAGLSLWSPAPSVAPGTPATPSIKTENVDFSLRPTSVSRRP